jgi:hypothetical protein
MSTHLYPEAAAHVMRVTETAHWLEWQDWADPSYRGRMKSVTDCFTFLRCLALALNGTRTPSRPTKPTYSKGDNIRSSARSCLVYPACSSEHEARPIANAVKPRGSKVHGASLVCFA